MHKVFLAVMLAMAASCANAQDFLRLDSSDSVIGQRYALSSWNGVDYRGDREVFIEFGAGPVMSGAICNRFSGPIERDGWTLTMENARTTRMACPDADLSKLEAAFLQSLRNGVAVVLAEDNLVMRRDDATFVFRRVDKNAAESAAAETGTEAGDDAAPVSWEDLSGKKFTLAKVDGEEFKPKMGKQPFIQFGDDHRVNGSACNNFMGAGELADGVLTMRNAASTMMMCVDQALSEYERSFHKLLGEGVAVKLNGDVLTLSGGDRALEFVLDEER